MGEAAIRARRPLLRLPRTIRGLAIAMAIASALVTAALGLATYAFVHEEIERQIDHRLEVETRALLQYERDHGFDALLEVIRIRDELALPVSSSGDVGPFDSDVERAMGYIVLDATGRRRAGLLEARMPPLGWSEFVHFVRPDGSRGVAQAIHSQLPDGGRMLVAADRAIVDHMDFVLLRLFAAAFGSLLLIGAVAMLIFGRTVRHRLHGMEARARAIMAGDMTQRMPVDGSGAELDRLAAILNRMLDRIATLVTNLREVSTGMAHELRTPLSRVAAKLERGEEMADNPALRELLRSANADAEQLLDLFGSFLAIAEIDAKAIRKRFKAVDLADAAAEITEAHRPALEDAGLVLDVQADPVWMNGDRPLLQRLVANLLDNVLAHASTATKVAVSVRAVDRDAVIRVADDGLGVPIDDRDRIFERLIRLDKSRSKPGHGLGLSMVAAIAAAHGGTVAVVPTNRGLAIELTLPALDPDDVSPGTNE